MNILKSSDMRLHTIKTPIVSGNTNLMTYSSPILVFSIIGEIITPIQNSACSANLQAQNDESTVLELSSNASIINFQENRNLISIFGNGALRITHITDHGYSINKLTYLFLKPDTLGKIYVNYTTSVTGLIKWNIKYLDLMEVGS